MPLNQIASRSRSAGSPALPTAITTRPQLASSPAIAVFTSGELAIDIAIRRADVFDAAPSTVISTSLRAPSPSRATCSARSASTALKRLAESREPRIGQPRDLRRAARSRGAGGEGEERVGGRSVAVDGHRVEGVGDAVAQQRLQHGGAIGASVKTNDSIVAMSGAIMPAPLAMPQIVTVGACRCRPWRSRPSERCRWS